MAVAGLVLGYVGIVLMLVVLPALLLPALSQAKAKAIQTACMSNMKQIALACYMYADDNEDVLPESFGQLTTYLGDDQLLTCPADTSGGPSYELIVSGRLVTSENPSGTVMIRETACRHNGGMNKAFVDGHVEWVSATADTEEGPLSR